MKNQYKYCNVCKQNLELPYFTKDRSRKDGLSHCCRNCRVKRSKKRRVKFVIEKPGHKVCLGCKKEQPLTNYFKSRRGRLGTRSRCKVCVGSHKKKLSNEQSLLYSAKRRSKLLNRNFDLDINDIVIPEKCPLLEIPLVQGNNKTSHNSPTLDRIDNNKGYEKGNVWVISHKANFIKLNCDIKDLELIYMNLKKHHENTFA